MWWFLIFGIIALFAFASYQDKKRRIAWKEKYFEFLAEKFGKEIQNQISKGSPWIGQTADAFIAMYGQPFHVETHELKTKTKLICSYSTFNSSTNRATNNKYTFENNIMVKTEIKGPIKTVWEFRKQINPFTGKLKPN